MQAFAEVFYRVPVIGWLTRDAVNGAPSAKYFYIFNVAMVFAALVYLLGYPFLIAYALTCTAAGLVFLVVLTGSDLIEELRRRRR